MAIKSNFTAHLHNPGYLRELVAGMGFVLTRGRGAGQTGSVQQFLDYLSVGEVIAFLPGGLEAGHLLEAADALEHVAAGLHPHDSARILLEGLLPAVRKAAMRQQELDDAEIEAAGEE